jgi:hypothetical protein
MFLQMKENKYGNINLVAVVVKISEGFLEGP